MPAPKLDSRNDNTRQARNLPAGAPRRGFRPSPIRLTDAYVSVNTPGERALTEAEQLQAREAIPEDIKARMLEGAQRAAMRGRTKRDLPDPAAPEEDQKQVTKKRFEGVPFVDRPDPRDTQQGYLGDCYLIAALSSIAHDNPRVLENAITENEDGTYRVRFYDAKGRAHYETVDADFYVKNDKMRYGRSLTERELWPAIIEKAYAQWKGDYGEIESGRGKDVFEALTGRTADRIATNDQSETRLWHRVNNAIRGGRPIVADTYGDEKKYDNSGVSDNHVYSVLGTQEEDGQRYVILRNPWADTEFRSSDYTTDVDFDNDGDMDGDDGIFRMRIDDFKRLFEHTDTIKPSF